MWQSKTDKHRYQISSRNSMIPFRWYLSAVEVFCHRWPASSVGFETEIADYRPSRAPLVVSSLRSRHWACPRRLQAPAGVNVPDAISVGRFSGDNHWPVLGDRWGL